MYENILVPTDGSDSVDRAIEQALGLAEADNATLHTLFVVERGPWIDHRGEQLRTALENEGKRATEDVAERGKERGIAVISEIRSGDPHREILEYADDHDVDLIVMGTQGRTGLDRYLLGSVTEKVVRLSERSVLTAPVKDGE